MMGLGQERSVAIILGRTAVSPTTPTSRIDEVLVIKVEEEL
jgi:hypothetical protein